MLVRYVVLSISAETSIFEALEGFLGIQGYWAKTQRDTGF